MEQRNNLLAETRKYEMREGTEYASLLSVLAKAIATTYCCLRYFGYSDAARCYFL